jgi:hypothetical protein
VALSKQLDFLFCMQIHCPAASIVSFVLCILTLYTVAIHIVCMIIYCRIILCLLLQSVKVLIIFVGF